MPSSRADASGETCVDGGARNAAAARRMEDEWAATEHDAALRLARLRLALCGGLEWGRIADTTGMDWDALRLVAAKAEALCGPPWGRRRALGLGFSADEHECARREAADAVLADRIALRSFVRAVVVA